MNALPQVAVLVGSVRANGLSARLARSLATLASGQLALPLVPIRDLPFYDQDTEEQAPPANIAFRDAIRRADAVLIVTAEYNRSIPAALKNALDVGSRPVGSNVFAGKPAAVISQSPGALGGVSASRALLPTMMALDMPVLPQPEIYLSHADRMFGLDGELATTAPVALLGQFLKAFAAWIDRHTR